MAVARICTPSGEARTASLRPLCLGHPWKGLSVDPLCRCLEVCLPGDSKSCQDVTVEVITHMVSCKVCPHEGHSQFDLLLRVFRTPLLLEPKASIRDTHSVCLQQPPGTAFSPPPDSLTHQFSLETPSRHTEACALLTSVAPSSIKMTAKLNHHWLVEHLSGMREALGSMPGTMQTRLCICGVLNGNGPHRLIALNTWSPGSGSICMA